MLCFLVAATVGSQSLKQTNAFEIGGSCVLREMAVFRDDMRIFVLAVEMRF
jgi:hypothetical protein